MSLEAEFLGGKFGNVAAQATTTHKTGPGILKGIIINKTANSGVLTVYDNTAGSGTKIATITMPATVLHNQVQLIYNLQFNTGLTIVGSGADMDYTAVWV